MLAVGAIAFAIQLYADFSGYSDIARGAAKTLGIALTNNFRTPYFSRSVTEFWRRWHISLSSWFRDYCFQPLALSLARISRAGIPVALFLTFLIIGLWHGAGWTYIVFGGLFGAYLVVGMLTKKIRERIARLIGLTKFPTLYAGLQMLVTFLLVCIGFVFFRTPSLTDAVYVIVHLALGWTAVLHNAFWSSLVLDSLVSVGLAKWRVLVIALSTLAMFIGEYVQTEHGAFAWFATQPRLLRWSAYYLIIFWILVFGYYQPRTFIYFQF
jgi:D-alanyl-lipoteichoic acid acyltransferase DltB (MBOAT superfamily)